VRLRLEPPSERTRLPARPPGQQSIIASLKRVLFGLMVFTVLTSLLLQAILKTGGPGKVVVPAAGGALLEEDEPPQRSPYPKSLNGIRQEGCVVMMLLLLLLLLLALARSNPPHLLSLSSIHWLCALSVCVCVVVRAKFRSLSAAAAAAAAAEMPVCVTITLSSTITMQAPAI